MKTKGPTQDSQNRLWSPMPEGGVHTFILIFCCFKKFHSSCSLFVLVSMGVAEYTLNMIFANIYYDLQA